MSNIFSFTFLQDMVSIENVFSGIWCCGFPAEPFRNAFTCLKPEVLFDKTTGYVYSF